MPGKTKLYGLEASAQGNFDGFSFDLSGSVSNSKLSTFFASDSRLGNPGALCNANAGPATARCIDLTGREQNYAPKFTFSGGVQYAIPLGGDATLTPRVDYAHVAAMWASLFQNTALGVRLEARDIVNTQLTFATGNWSAAGFATN